MGNLFKSPKREGYITAKRMQAKMEEEHRDAVRSSARLAGLASGKVTQTRARPTSGGLGGGGQAQRTGGIMGGKIGGPLGQRGPAGTTATE